MSRHHLSPDAYSKERRTVRFHAEQAMLFDMDGVITRSAQDHGTLWKEVFDEFLQGFSARNNIPFQPFDATLDYHSHVDGKPRYDGVMGFLASRGIVLPFGEPTDDGATETCCGLGNKKNALFMRNLELNGIGVFESTVDLIREMRRHGSPIAVVSASKNSKMVLEKAGLIDYFDAMVSGREAADLSLAGKPAPDTYLKAAELLRTPPERCVVFEDSVTGIQAAKAAKTGLIIGLDRAADTPALLWHGADVVVGDLSDLIVEWNG